MRPPSVYAKRSCPAGDPCDLLGLLHGPHRLADRPRPGRPRLGSRRLGARIRRLLAQPRAWTIPLLHLYLGRPAISLHTLHRRVREVAAWRRPRLVAKGDPDRDQVLAALRQAIAELPQDAVDLASGRFCYQVCRKAVSASFTAFCEQLLAAYPTAPVVAVVCDNVIIH